jgi:hypothetical protein
MSESCTCDNCGVQGRRRRKSIAPDEWFFLESQDEGGIHIVLACSSACAIGLWKKGPGRLGLMPGDDLLKDAEAEPAFTEESRAEAIAELEGSERYPLCRQLSLVLNSHARATLLREMELHEILLREEVLLETHLAALRALFTATSHAVTGPERTPLGPADVVERMQREIEGTSVDELALREVGMTLMLMEFLEVSARSLRATALSRAQAYLEKRALPEKQA